MNVNVQDYGAVADGKTLCTKAIQSAIDACNASGGGRVTVPAGTYLIGTLWLKDNVELHLAHGSVLKGSTNMDDYNDVDAYPQNWSDITPEKWLGKHMILAVEVDNVAITGTGILDGSADAFLGEAKFHSVYCWSQGLSISKDDEVMRPGQMICFIESQHITVENITLRNQPCWGCYLHGCDWATIRGLKIFNPPQYGNSDGIDIDCCSHVTISDCIIDTGDDAIAIRGQIKWIKNKEKPCEYVTISNCVLGSSSSVFRIGVGEGWIRHVRVNNLTVTRGGPLFTIATGYRGLGHVSIEDVRFSNVSATNIAVPVDLSEQSATDIKNITMENCYVETYGNCKFYSDSTETVRNITLRNFHCKLIPGPEPFTNADLKRRGTIYFRAENIRELTLENVRIDADPELMAPWTDGVFGFINCPDLVLKNVTPEA